MAGHRNKRSRAPSPDSVRSMTPEPVLYQPRRVQATSPAAQTSHKRPREDRDFRPPKRTKHETPEPVEATTSTQDHGNTSSLDPRVLMSSTGRLNETDVSAYIMGGNGASVAQLRKAVKMGERWDWYYFGIDLLFADNLGNDMKVLACTTKELRLHNSHRLRLDQKMDVLMMGEPDSDDEDLFVEDPGELAVDLDEGKSKNQRRRERKLERKMKRGE